MRTHFRHSGHRKKRLGQIRFSQVLCSEWPLQLICFLAVSKYNFGKVDEMYEGVERPYELIFCTLVIEKSDFNEVA
jgi:hypothetical protein